MDEAVRLEFDYDCTRIMMDRWRDIVISAIYKMEAQIQPDRHSIVEAKRYLLAMAHEQAALRPEDEDAISAARTCYSKLIRLFQKVRSTFDNIPPNTPLLLAQFEKAQQILRRQLAVRDWWLWQEQHHPAPDQARIETWRNERLLLGNLSKALRYDHGSVIRKIISSYGATASMGLDSSTPPELVLEAGNVLQDSILT